MHHLCSHPAPRKESLPARAHYGSSSTGTVPCARAPCEWHDDRRRRGVQRVPLPGHLCDQRMHRWHPVLVLAVLPSKRTPVCTAHTRAPHSTALLIPSLVREGVTCSGNPSFATSPLILPAFHCQRCRPHDAPSPITPGQACEDRAHHPGRRLGRQGGRI